MVDLHKIFDFPMNCKCKLNDFWFPRRLQELLSALLREKFLFYTGIIVVRGLFSAKVHNSSFAEVRMGLLIEPTQMEDEDEEQENEKEDERDGGECRVEGRRVSDQTHNQTQDDMT